MKKVTMILFGLGMLVFGQAKADLINSLKGTWQEVGIRCAGDSTYEPRDNYVGKKYFTIGAGIYFHRVDLNNPNCPTVQSAGRLQVVDHGDHVEITAHALVNQDCGMLQDDFSPKLDWNKQSLRMEDLNGISYMIAHGKPNYSMPQCTSGVVERVYGKIK